jgi:hypothetical protein
MGNNAFNVTPLHNLDKSQKEQVWSAIAKIYDRGIAQ